ncbi:MAG: elongation factor 4 [Candidatus Cloacimonetes bacterium]|jgi:GTP-binding protein LepA|nr:elongation factor 4 [Candidatus Cloacimonadota bacterium]MBT6993398.1 elongation factor 4 [Candidatus Cloacimonadota bacterium]MBT7469865.1 elongation factor 4 [Candidatus Cloacimonadota bacterium]
MNKERIRNFCIIAHIDHGKSTLADRFLEVTNVIDKNARVTQILDDMELEQERGITIKSHAIRMEYVLNGEKYVLNLIDTPGHVDFSYEVSRSLASCDGALLLIDASQGIEAQTMSNMYLALENDLEIIPVINKIDLPKADIEGTHHDIIENIGIDTIYNISAKEGIGIDELLKGVIEHIPAPKGDIDAPTKALIFDSYFDVYRGVIVLVRIFEGTLKKGDNIKLFSNNKEFAIEEIGYLGLKKEPAKLLEAGEVGYIIANIKEVADARVGDTITHQKNSCDVALKGFQEPKPMVFSGVFPIDGDDYGALRDSLAKLKLNDAALDYEPENSLALGFGFRCGFLGMLHLEIIKERLLREYNVPIIATTPSVRFIVNLNNGDHKIVYNPIDYPDPALIENVEEPIMDAEIIVPTEYVGNVMKLVQNRRGIQKDMQYIDETRASIHYEVPLIEIIFDFYDKLKSVSRGYASLDYSFKEYRASKVAKVDILINSEKVDAMSFICHEDKAYSWGKSVVDKLKDVIPKHLFKIALQASIGSKIISRSTIGAMRKNVTAKCYGGDITRKKKLLEKQKEGKKRMKEIGSVAIPQEAFLEVLKADRS